MKNLAVVNSDKSIILILFTLEWSPIQFVCVCVCVCVCVHVHVHVHVCVGGWGRGVWALPIIRKNCLPFPPFPFINTVLWNKDFYIFLVPLFVATNLPATLLINHISHLPLEDGNVIWSMLRTFLKMQNLQEIKHKKCLMEEETVEPLCWSFLQKKLTANSCKSFVQIVPP